MSQRTYWDEPRRNVFRCAECSTIVRDADEVAHDQTCRCGEALHSCRHCAFFDSAAENECRGEVKSRIPRKGENNGCELFKPVMVVDLMGSGKGQTTDEARQAFDDLFKT